MVTPVIIPKVGVTVESCIIGSWRKKEGGKVKKGDILLEIETDKTTFEVEAPESGTLLEIFFREGDIVPVMTNIAVIGEEGEEFEPYRPKPEEKKEELTKQPAEKRVKKKSKKKQEYLKVKGKSR